VKILIADDDPVSRRLLEATLVRLGHEVVQVSDGLQAVETVLQPDGPRFVILDWVMPGADGITACKTIRQRSVSYIYIVLLTTRDRREDMIQVFDAEADDFLTKPFDSLELGARLRSGERVLGLQEQLIAAHEALRHEATHDRLTGLWNRGRILDQLGRELTRCRREHRPLSLLIADIDHFKAANDTHGHQLGDEVLREVGVRMQAICGERDCIGRYGGEEFLIVLPGCDAVKAMDVAEKMRQAVARDPVFALRAQVPATVSIGVASTDRAEEQPAVIIHAADEALYRAKAAGRNRVDVTPVLIR
jgi:diguanylate cyclase (GGDEF)-like protein